MQTVVTGAAGFVGSHLCEHLVADGHEVVGVDAFTDYYGRARKEANLTGLLKEPRFRLVEADLRHDPLEPLLDGADVVINQSAMPGLPRSWTDMEAYTSCNLVAVYRLLEACRVTGVRKVVQASTSSVYGRQAVGDETIPTCPVSPYGVTKLAAEHLVMAYVDTFGLPATILRYFSIYGPRQRPDMAYHIFIEAMRAGLPITVYGDGSQSRTSTFVEDCVRGTIQAVHGAQVGEVYNIGGGEPVTLNDAITIVAQTLGVEPIVRYEAPRAGDQRHTRADTRKAESAFGYRPLVTPAEGLPRQVRWHLEWLPRVGVAPEAALGGRWIPTGVAQPSTSGSRTA